MDNLVLLALLDREACVGQESLLRPLSMGPSCIPAMMV